MMCPTAELPAANETNYRAIWHPVSVLADVFSENRLCSDIRLLP